MTKTKTKEELATLRKEKNPGFEQVHQSNQYVGHRSKHGGHAEQNEG